MLRELLFLFYFLFCLYEPKKKKPGVETIL